MSKDKRNLKCVNCNAQIKVKHIPCPNCRKIWFNGAKPIKGEK